MSDAERTIDEVLALRADLSTFLVHFTKTADGVAARDRLRTIVQEKRLRAGVFVPPISRSLSVEQSSAGCVCFTETPLNLASLLLGRIRSRQNEYEPYGIAITKRLARGSGVNPVWYLDTTPGHGWLSKKFEDGYNAISQSIREADASSRDLDNASGRVRTSAEPQNAHDIDSATNHIGALHEHLVTTRRLLSELSPFLQVMGSQGTPNEFWWEREWRHQGDMALPTRYIILCPEDEIAEFEQAGDVKALDPTWSLEVMLARLAGFSDMEVRQIPRGL